MITLYCKTNCIQCKKTKLFLDAHRIPYIEKNIEEKEEFREEVKLYGFQSVPVLIPNASTGLNPWFGFRPDELRKLKQK
ncbi:glutaredoxin domain-containing protein [Enterococcus gallinarum]|uniref:Glutaredoxin domain-containing protein n=1 Tax=Enterococcus gallinarum TaxID=1353 RepID=A0ABD4ZV56_ENTGA|nr:MULTISPECIES: glutaredoxin domain-containing protein [Enterococcus]MBF0824338.1 NrdH-redoxin [Enterococcus faecalis]MBF0727638.1 NrdH-redoxin [Enterococcus gallinarum]MBF0798479.1 NrdH-redoxin [Enterococcus gallinarum]MBO6419476.1 NrdH-redoxin [Enterococcus gallinarum]MBO6421781.1 NrdH-redoxin [Enterococcus gallinarum]